MSSSKAVISNKTKGQLEGKSPALATSRSHGEISTTRVGKLCGKNPDGAYLVDYTGNVLGPLPARALARCVEILNVGQGEESEVLLVFENGDPKTPIIIGSLAVSSPQPILEAVTVAGRPTVVKVDGDTLVFDAKKDIILRCGSASIELHTDGTVIVKGRRIVSRASETNKIKGGNVAIN
jgi:hypothetical protein